MRSLSVQWKITLLSGLCLIIISTLLIAFSIYNAHSNQLMISSLSSESVINKSQQLLKRQADLNASETSNLLGKSGAVVTKIALNNPTTGDWYVLPQANFIDVGLAYWQTEQGDIVKLADFSQSHVNQPAILMHGQAFKLPFYAPSSGYLWIYLEAKHYPTPVDLSILSEGAFLHHQFLGRRDLGNR